MEKLVKKDDGGNLPDHALDPDYWEYFLGKDVGAQEDDPTQQSVDAEFFYGKWLEEQKRLPPEKRKNPLDNIQYEEKELKEGEDFPF
jgi:hypothetical protein